MIIIIIMIIIISHTRKLRRGKKKKKEGNLKREIEFFLITAHKNTLRTNYIKARIDNTQQNCKCRLCAYRDETINHIISECSKLAQWEY